MSTTRLTPTITAIIIGDKEVGKSCFHLRVFHDNFTYSHISTEQSNYEFKTVSNVIPGTSLKIQLWDYVTKPKKTLRFPPNNITLVFLMYDVTDEQSFQNIKLHHQHAKKLAQEKVSMILVGNKCDMTGDKVVEHERGKQLADGLGIPFFETSAKTNTNVLDALTYGLRNAYYIQHQAEDKMAQATINLTAKLTTELKNTPSNYEIICALLRSANEHQQLQKEDKHFLANPHTLPFLKAVKNLQEKVINDVESKKIADATYIQFINYLDKSDYWNNLLMTAKSESNTFVIDDIIIMLIDWEKLSQHFPAKTFLSRFNNEYNQTLLMLENTGKRIIDALKIKIETFKLSLASIERLYPVSYNNASIFCIKHHLRQLQEYSIKLQNYNIINKVSPDTANQLAELYVKIITLQKILEDNLKDHTAIEQQLHKDKKEEKSPAPKKEDAPFVAKLFQQMHAGINFAATSIGANISKIVHNTGLLAPKEEPEEENEFEPGLPKNLLSSTSMFTSIAPQKEDKSIQIESVLREGNILKYVNKPGCYLEYPSHERREEVMTILQSNGLNDSAKRANNPVCIEIFNRIYLEDNSIKVLPIPTATLVIK